MLVKFTLGPEDDALLEEAFMEELWLLFKLWLDNCLFKWSMSGVGESLLTKL